jgi:hypothetical protein
LRRRSEMERRSRGGGAREGVGRRGEVRKPSTASVPGPVWHAKGIAGRGIPNVGFDLPKMDLIARKFDTRQMTG